MNSLTDRVIFYARYPGYIDTISRFIENYNVKDFMVIYSKEALDHNLYDCKFITNNLFDSVNNKTLRIHSNFARNILNKFQPTLIVGDIDNKFFRLLSDFDQSIILNLGSGLVRNYLGYRTRYATWNKIYNAYNNSIQTTIKPYIYGAFSYKLNKIKEDILVVPDYYKVDRHGSLSKFILVIINSKSRHEKIYELTNDLPYKVVYCSYYPPKHGEWYSYSDKNAYKQLLAEASVAITNCTDNISMDIAMNNIKHIGLPDSFNFDEFINAYYCNSVKVFNIEEYKDYSSMRLIAALSMVEEIYKPRRTDRLSETNTLEDILKRKFNA